ncbi:MAG: TonB-dependent receptor [Xanthomonadales bacterium]|nr:TonB-dependent receptor [Xanthomonadales bacterium]
MANRQRKAARASGQNTNLESTLLRRSALSVAVAAALAFGSAYAQETENEEENQDQQEQQVDETIGREDRAELERIEVTGFGFSQSLASSRDLKLSSDKIVEAVVAEDIGKLPDISITESLARLPGLTAQRLNGRGQVISIRGLSPDFSTALLNGRQQVSSGDNRGVEFDQYPSELINAAVVYKTPDASLIGQGLSGTVDLRTVRPLEYGNRAMAGMLQYEQNDLEALNSDADDSGGRLSFSYVDQFNDNTLGVAFGISYLDNPSQGERYNAWGYPSVDGALVLGGAKPYVRTSELERTGVIGTLEYVPSDTFSTSVDLYYSEFKEDQLLRGIELPLFWSAAQLQPGFDVQDGLVVEGQFNDVKGVIRNDLNTRDSELFALGWNVDWQIDDLWSATFDIGYSQIDREDIILETYSGTGPAGAGPFDNLGFNVSPGAGTRFFPSINYADPNQIVLTSPQGWGGDIVPGGQVGYFNAPSIDDELTQIKFFADRPLDGAINNMEFGINLDNREKSLVADEFFLALASGGNTQQLPPTSVTSLDFLGIPGMLGYDPLAAVNSGTYDLRRNPNADVIIKSWNVEEDVNTLYAKFDVDTVWGSVPVFGNFGVQFVFTDQFSNAFAATGTGDNVTAIPISGGSDYTDVLPSLNLNFDLGNDNYIRFGLARTMARPRMDDMRASQQYGFDTGRLDSTDINNSPWSANGGNPELEPWIANQVDLSYEKYFADEIGYFAGAVFYKDLETYIYNETTVQDFSDFPTGGLTPALNQGLVSTPQNGEGGEIYGIELALSFSAAALTPALEGFGATFNASFTESKIQPDPNSPDTPLPGLSEDVANVTLFYERGGFGARVSNRYRSEFLGEVAGFGNGRTLRMVEDENVVDAQISYTFDTGTFEGMTVLLQALNLTDEEFTTVNGGDSRQVIDYQRYGRSYLLGFTYKF